MTTAQRLVIPGWLPEPLANGAHGHWSVAYRKRQTAGRLAALSARQARWQPVMSPARLDVLFIFPVDRRRDTDNLYSRAKGLVDGLVRGGYIPDDDARVLDLVVRAEVRHGVRQTELTLEAT